MNKKPDISIIVPVYKGIKFLRAALESVKTQTFQNWECICVDDGAKDGSGNLADEIAATDDRICVIHQKNGGTSVARNTGMAAARGKYFAFLDEDDLYHPHFLETLYSAAEKYGADIASCEMTKFPEDVNPKMQSNSEVVWSCFDKEGVKELLSRLYNGVPFEIWRSLYRADVFGACKFPERVRVEQDLKWLYMNIFKCRKYVCTKWSGYFWRQSSIGGYLNPDVDSCLSLLHTYCEILSKFSAEAGFSDSQFAEFKLQIEHNINRNVREPIFNGMKFDRGKLPEFRNGLASLRAYGVDVRHILCLKKRFKWIMFTWFGWR